MDCPRCGGSLVTYALGEEQTAVCESCGYVGVPADHRTQGTDPESWDEALRRFRRRRGTVAVEVGGATYHVAPAVAERYRERTDKQRAVIRELLREDTPTDPDRTHAEIAESAGVHPSYVGEVIDAYGELAAALNG